MDPIVLLEVQIGELLTHKGLKLALAESCTGGLISHRITNVAGSSGYFLGSLVSYSYGAVSRETVIEMARGARASLKKHFPMEGVIGLSVSGIAGPGGGMPDKPVGTVWIGLSAAGIEDAWQFLWEGNRGENKEQSANKALQILGEYLINLH
jgi:nicotinamide mononucleotide (NMN) deamidase PncC